MPGQLPLTPQLTYLPMPSAVFLLPVLQLGVEYHKRFDPIYSDARNRARNLGPFSYFYSYMAQPKQQLDTFRAWAGKSSDINYYLNSHHIDVHNWMVSHMSHPTRVTALAATGALGTSA